MPKGRTAWQILTGVQKELSIADSIVNPLAAKVGSHVTIGCSLSDVELTSDELWRITEIWAWDRDINGQKHSLTDYVIESDDKRLVIRVVPDGSKHRVLVMSQYYPDTPGPMLWNEESPFVLEAITDKSGEFYRNRGEENEEKYWRIGGNIPIICDVRILRDLDGNETVEDSEVAREPFTLWDFHRATTGDVGQEITQYLYVQLNGHYDTKRDGSYRIVDGDKTILILRGEEVDPTFVTIF